MRLSFLHSAWWKSFWKRTRLYETRDDVRGNPHLGYTDLCLFQNQQMRENLQDPMEIRMKLLLSVLHAYVISFALSMSPHHFLLTWLAAVEGFTSADLFSFPLVWRVELCPGSCERRQSLPPKIPSSDRCDRLASLFSLERHQGRIYPRYLISNQYNREIFFFPWTNNVPISWYV